VIISVYYKTKQGRVGVGHVGHGKFGALRPEGRRFDPTLAAM